MHKLVVTLAVTLLVSGCSGVDIRDGAPWGGGPWFYDADVAELPSVRSLGDNKVEIIVSLSFPAQELRYCAHAMYTPCSDDGFRCKRAAERMDETFKHWRLVCLLPETPEMGAEARLWWYNGNGFRQHSFFIWYDDHHVLAANDGSGAYELTETGIAMPQAPFEAPPTPLATVRVQFCCQADEIRNGEGDHAVTFVASFGDPMPPVRWRFMRFEDYAAGRSFPSENVWEGYLPPDNLRCGGFYDEHLRFFSIGERELLDGAVLRFEILSPDGEQIERAVDMYLEPYRLVELEGPTTAREVLTRVDQTGAVLIQ